MISNIYLPGSSAKLHSVKIIHGRTRKVPRTISFDQLVDIAILVDKRDVLEAIEPFPDIWITNQALPVPTSYSRNVMTWFMLAWVFQKSELFAKMGSILERQGDGSFGEDGEDLPLPCGLVGKPRFLFVSHCV
jgi:hypothetical protein